MTTPQIVVNIVASSITILAGAVVLRQVWTIFKG